MLLKSLQVSYINYNFEGPISLLYLQALYHDVLFSALHADIIDPLQLALLLSMPLILLFLFETLQLDEILRSF
jgi:hypothetical protein